MIPLHVFLWIAKVLLISVCTFWGKENHTHSGLEAFFSGWLKCWGDCSPLAKVYSLILLLFILLSYYLWHDSCIEPHRLLCESLWWQLRSAAYPDCTPCVCCLVTDMSKVPLTCPDCTDSYTFTFPILVVHSLSFWLALTVLLILFFLFSFLESKNKHIFETIPQKDHIYIFVNQTTLSLNYRQHFHRNKKGRFVLSIRKQNETVAGGKYYFPRSGSTISQSNTSAC